MLLFIRFHPRSADPAGAASSRPEEDGPLDAVQAETGRAMRAEDAALVPAASPAALLAVGSGQPPGRHRNAGPRAAWRTSGSNEGVGDTGSQPVCGPGELRDLPGAGEPQPAPAVREGTSFLPQPRSCFGTEWTWHNHVFTVNSVIQFCFLSPVDIGAPHHLYVVSPLGFMRSVCNRDT